jgi:hypothetical protein
MKRLVARFVRLDCDVLEISAQHRAAAVAEFPADDRAFMPMYPLPRRKKLSSGLL